MRNDKKLIFKRVVQVLFSLFVGLVIIAALIFVTQGRDMPVLDTHGLIADQERNLIILTTGIGVVVVVPVFIMLFSIAWRYRAGNTKAKYEPEFESHRGLEALWWGIPCLIILVLAAITVVSTHALDPYKSLDSQKEPVKIQVISMEWKWLFIYEDKGVATLNYMNIPEGTPIELTITSDAPMNSLWIPALAGQVYAMTGMSTKLHLVANSTGTYRGSSANISGEGFADMNFKVNSLSENDFNAWLKTSANSKDLLTTDAYNKLSKQSHNNPETTYALMNATLYNEVIMKYMPAHNSEMSEAHH
jgi:cytochrome o ubiquinol oxidase subunit 2